MNYTPRIPPTKVPSTYVYIDTHTFVHTVQHKYITTYASHNTLSSDDVLYNITVETYLAVVVRMYKLI